MDFTRFLSAHFETKSDPKISQSDPVRMAHNPITHPILPNRIVRPAFNSRAYLPQRERERERDGDRERERGCRSET